MGKARKKIKKNIQKQQTGKPSRKILQQAKEEMQQFIDLDQYDEALEKLAALVERKIYDADLVYQGAYCYFMLCDYERAATWLNNTLTLDGHHLKARLLLARLCILEDRIDDGMDIYEFIISNYRAKLTEEQQEEIRDVLDFYSQYEQEKIQSRPELAVFLGEES